MGIRGVWSFFHRLFSSVNPISIEPLTLGIDMFSLVYTHRESLDELLEKMYYAQVPLAVLVGGTRMNVAKVLELKQGDVIRLDRIAGTDLLMCINHKPKFFCQPGVLRQNMAVCIQNKVPEPQALKGFALDTSSGDALEDDLYPTVF
jgi:flagellar motor switch protein FliM